ARQGSLPPRPRQRDRALPRSCAAYRRTAVVRSAHNKRASVRRPFFPAGKTSYFLAASAAGALVLLDDDDAAGAAGAIVLLDEEELGAAIEPDVDEDVSGAFVASDELDAEGAGAVGAGETVEVLDVLAAGEVAGGVAVVVLDFCSLHADRASVSAAAAISVLYMAGIPLRWIVVVVGARALRPCDTCCAAHPVPNVAQDDLVSKGIASETRARLRDVTRGGHTFRLKVRAHRPQAPARPSSRSRRSAARAVLPARAHRSRALRV